MISPLIPADDFARQLPLDELAALASSDAAVGRVAVCSAIAMDVDAVRQEVGVARAAALMRELILFVRRNLRGIDAISINGDEMILLIEASAQPATVVAERLLAAVRAHVFTGVGPDTANRFQPTATPRL